MFEILVNTLALSQALVAVGSQTISRVGTKTLSKLMPQGAAGAEGTRAKELFNVLFNCMLLSQAAGELLGVGVAMRVCFANALLLHGDVGKAVLLLARWRSLLTFFAMWPRCS